NILDEGENIISSSIVCNGNSGQDGQDGIGAGIIVENAPPGSCSAGGSILKTYTDANNNTLLDNGEAITSTTTICNGSNGSDGANGSSAYLSVSQASSQQCAAGGVVYTSSQTGQETPDVTVVCNGEAGQDANFIIGAVGPMVDGQSYSACYHDYLYIPNANENDRGWLTFRHQANGSQDRGIGNTGFQIWNVDIPNFSLASEVGNETFCNLNWNAASKVLNYTVQTNRDGLSGESGVINLED
ncbi:hypothetical protein GW915_09495, partial [bacterium]|nr:hypothetical protein [bacterium]